MSLALDTVLNPPDSPRSCAQVAERAESDLRQPRASARYDREHAASQDTTNTPRETRRAAAEFEAPGDPRHPDSRRWL